MELAKSKDLCCGCSACESICPSGGDCLSLKYDKEGFLYPIIDEEKCISCHACERVCFYQTGKEEVKDRLASLQAYAVKAKEETLRFVSQSGGAFGTVANHVIHEGGIVYGCVFDDVGVARHVRATSFEDLANIHGSKYVQSDLRKIFLQVKQDLQTAKWVLFSGTPCQVMGLRKFLHRTHDNLLTIDIICYGVPSPLVWRDFLAYHSKKSYGTLKKIEHRAKQYGWHKCLSKLTYEHKTIVTDGWNFFWGSALAIRPSCYYCRFTNLDRPGDLTVGDCWGAEKKMPQFDDNHGISMVLLNTHKGLKIYQSIQDEFDARTIDIEEYKQPRLRIPVEMPSNRNLFWRDYADLTTSAFIKKYARYSFKQRMRRFLAQITLLRNFYKRFF